MSRESETLGIGSNSLALSTGALSAAAACMVHSMVDFNMHIPANALVMAFVFGVLANPGGEVKVSSRESKGGFRLHRRFRLLAPAVGVSILAFALPKLPAEIYGERARLVLSDWRYMESLDVALAAEDFARRGLSFDQKNPELFYYLGEAQVAQAAMASGPREKRQLFSESADAYAKAVELAPHDTRLLICLATSLDAAERFDEAAPHYARAMELDPLSGFVYWAYASHLHAQKKWPEAEAAYRSSLERGGGASAQMGLDRLNEERKAASPDLNAPPPGGPVPMAAPAPPRSAAELTVHEP